MEHTYSVTVDGKKAAVFSCSIFGLLAVQMGRKLAKS